MMATNTNSNNSEKISARNELWRRGILSWLLDVNQKELYDLFYNSNHKIMTWLLARRSGKTYALAVLAIEQCIRKPNSIVKFIAPTKLQITQIVKPIFKQILESCPADTKPEFKQQPHYVYYFPNGSEIQLAGTDSGHAEKLRGADCHLWIIDEAGSCADLDNVVKSVLLPTTLITRGKGILASTPPRESEHDFLKYIEDAQLKGILIKKTVYENPRITKEQLDELIAEYGGLHTDAARRELLCEIIKDSKTAVLPEFDSALEKQIVKEWPKPPFFDAYEGMDTGGKDLTVVLYGYYDFRANKIIIEDETVVDFQQKDTTIELLVKEINKKEKELWCNPISKEYKAPYIRVSDISYILTQEIYNHSKKLFPQAEAISFQPTKKDDNDAMINNLRILLANEKIIIHPRCKTLIRHLSNVKWDKNKTKFMRSADNGHYDAVDALKYFVRNVQLNKNPYPSHYDLSTKDLFIRDPEKFNSNNQIEVFKNIFNVRSKRKF